MFVADPVEVTSVSGERQVFKGDTGHRETGRRGVAPHIPEQDDAVAPVNREPATVRSAVSYSNLTPPTN